MRWKQGRRSTNVEDRRGRRVSRRGAGLGCGTVVIAIVASLIFGIDPFQVIQLLGGAQTSIQQQAPPPSQAGGPDDELKDFVAVVLGDTEDTWGQIFAQSGERYPQPRLVLYTDMVQSACGMNSAATGPFYCPGDQQVYLDLGFLNELKRLGANGDFAFAYVIAHEVGHHIQRVTGIEGQVRDMQRRSSKAQANRLSVMMELQADCYAGIWAHHAHTQRQMLEQGDIEEAMRAAASIGDDRLQQMSGRVVRPEAFTHGSSDQRVTWFRKGFQAGRVDACDTFNSGV